MATPRGYDRDAAQPPRRQLRGGDEERGRRPRRLRLGGRPAAAAAVRPHLHLRDARARLHAASELRRVRREARDLRRRHREDSLPAGPRGHGGGAAAGVPVRPPRRARRTGQLLGIPAGVLLRAARRVQLAHQPARRAGRVPRHGEGAASRRHRGDPRRRVQSHDRRKPGRADDLLSRPRQRVLLHPAGRQVALRRLHGMRQHAERQPAHRPPHDPGQPALLGHPDARRWIPIRPRIDPLARRKRPAAAQPAGAVGHRIRSAARRNETHRRSLGRGRPVPGRQLHRGHVAGMERPVPRRRAPVLEGRQRHGPGTGHAAAGQPRPLRSRGAGSGTEHQLRHLPRRFLAERSGLVQPEAQRGERRGQPRRLRRQPQLELRRRGIRPAIPGSRRFATGR